MEPFDRLMDNIQRVYMGNPDAVEKIITCLLARGHVLIEDVPGVGKTVLASAVARSVDCSLSRIQLTPDLLPGDILGVTVWDQHKGEFVFKPGPIFSNIILADEINRTTPRTQSALLEAMNEAQVSVDGHTRRLEQPFFVIATQNPHEFEGTYFLPESQLDRFMMRIHLGYPGPEAEARILSTEPSREALTDLRPVLQAEELLEWQRRVPQVRADPVLVDYVVELAARTRGHEQIEVGISTRGALMLVRAAKARALLQGRDYVVPEDLVTLVRPVWGHRLVSRTALHEADDHTTARLIQEVLQSVAAPV